jgi:hypothetical protein
VKSSAFVLCLFSLILSISLETSVSAQKTPTKNASKISDSAAEKQQEFLNRMEKVRNLVGRAKTFSNVVFRVHALMGLAEAIWRHDRNYAEQILVETYKSLPPNSAPPQTSSQNYIRSKTVLNLSPEGRLRSEIRALLMRLSPQSVKKLGNLGDSEEAQLSNLEAVRSLLSANADAGEIKQFWEASVKNGVSNETTMTLGEFRQRHQQITDDLFLQTLASLSAQGEISGDLLNELGNYVFAFDAQAQESGGMISTVVGKVMVSVLREPRINVSESLIRAYLQFAANVLSRQISDPREKESYYVTAYQLLPHFRRFAPEAEATVSLAMQRLIGEIPPLYARPEIYRGITGDIGKSQNYASVEYEKTIEQARDNDQKDSYSLQAAARLFQAGNIERARFYADKINNIFLAEKVKNLLDFAASLESIKNNDVSAAVARAEKMAKGLETSVLWLEIAAAQIKAKDAISARSSLLNVDRTLRDASDGDAALVRLRAAGLYAGIKDYAAFTSLSETIKAYNRMSEKNSWGHRWQIKLESDFMKNQGRNIPFLFPLLVAERPSLSKSLQPLLEMDTSGVESAVSDLKNEVALTSALIALAKFYLNSTGENRQKVKSSSAVLNN